MKREAGYATLAVTSLLGALSVVGIAYANLGVAEAKRADAVVDQITIDTALEGALMHVAADLVEGSLAPEALGQTRQRRFAEFELVSRITDEALKTNIRTAAAEDIAAALGETARAVRPDKRALSLEPVLQEYEGGLAPVCLRERLTVFQPAAPARPRGRGAQTRIADGAILRVQIEAAGVAPPRGLDVKLLLTGDRRDPFWIMGWRRYTGAEIAEGACV